MLIKKEEVKKRLKTYLINQNKMDLVVSQKNQLFDLAVFKVGKDEFYKIVFLNKYSQIEKIKSLLLNNIYSNFLIKRNYYIVIPEKDNFRFIKL